MANSNPIKVAPENLTHLRFSIAMGYLGSSAFDKSGMTTQLRHPGFK